MKRAQIVLTPNESKRLIAKATVSTDAVRDALDNGIVTIHPSSTTYHMVEFITGEKAEGIWVIGMICPRGTCVEGLTQQAFEKDKYQEISDPANFPFSWVFRKGKLEKGWKLAEILNEMSVGDVYIKGVNALDAHGYLGVLIASLAGGTISKAAAAQRRRGFKMIYVAGLEKLVPTTLRHVAKETGRHKTEVAFGIPCGLWTTKGECITEVEAFRILTDVEAIPFAGGGVGGAEGSVVMVLKGEDQKVEKAIQLFKEVKGARLPKIMLPDCETCHFPGCNFSGQKMEW
ncbi:MAG TPA: hypothetical protein VMW89_17155 [Desulfatiglandales bacterium]|nr:hypothetical protein [Desulfatiglandales bacterium]